MLYLHVSFTRPSRRVFSGAGSCRGPSPCWPLHPRFALPRLGPPWQPPACLDGETLRSWVCLWRKPPPVSTEAPSRSQTSQRAKQGVEFWVGGFSSPSWGLLPRGDRCRWSCLRRMGAWASLLLCPALPLAGIHKRDKEPFTNANFSRSYYFFTFMEKEKKNKIAGTVQLPHKSPTNPCTQLIFVTF